MPSEWIRTEVQLCLGERRYIQHFKQYIQWNQITITHLMNKKLKECTIIPECQFGFIPGRSTTDAIFRLKQTVEKHREGRKDINVVFKEIHKAYDRIPIGGRVATRKGTAGPGKEHSDRVM